jgi:anti-anti-sigma regulatory factor
MTTQTATFALNAPGKDQDHDAFWQFLTDHTENPISIDVSATTEISAGALQLLISAHKQWVADGVPLALAGATESFRDSLTRLGVTPDFFEKDRLS